MSQFITPPGGGGGGTPSWVLVGDSKVADLDLWFENDLYWWGGAEHKRSDLSQIWNFQRATQGVAETLSSRVVIPFAPNVPRITDKGYLAEPRATNLIFPNGDFTNANWTKTLVAVQNTSVTYPDGNILSINNEIVTNNAGAAAVLELVYDPGALNSALQYAFSCYILLENPNNPWFQIKVALGDGTVVWQYFQPRTQTAIGSWGILGSKSGNFDCFLVPSFAAPGFTAGVQWFRLVVNFPVKAGGAHNVISIRFCGTDQGVADPTATNATGAQAWLWKPQLESWDPTGNTNNLFETWPTSPIDTTIGPATRNADGATISSGPLFNLITANAPIVMTGSYWSQGVLAALGSLTSIFGNFLMDFEDYGVDIPPQIDDQLSYGISVTGGSGFWRAVDGNTWNPHRIAFGGDAGGTSAAYNGILGTDAGVWAGPATSIAFAGTNQVSGDGDPGGSGQYCGYIRRATFWSSRLTDATLTALTV